MTPATVLGPQIETYLARVRAALRGLTTPEIDDILRELRSHIADLTRAGTDMKVALRSLGDPVDLAKTYRSENQMVRAECSGSPLVILQGLRHSARSSLGRITATALYFFAYANVLALWAAAVEKLFAPSRTGLWITPGNIWSLRLVTDSSAPTGAHELLGWWLVPIAIGVGLIFRAITDRIAQWWIRRYRHSKVAREV